MVKGFVTGKFEKYPSLLLFGCTMITSAYRTGNTLLVKWEPLPRGLIRKIKGGYQHEKDESQKVASSQENVRRRGSGGVLSEGEIVRKWNSWEHLPIGLIGVDREVD